MPYPVAAVRGKIFGRRNTLLDNLVAFWKLDEASGTRYDSVGANHLTDNNTVGQAAGKVGNAAQFVAANSEYLSISDNPDVRTGNVDFAITAWIYFDTLTDPRALLSKREGSTSEFMLNHHTSDNRIRFQIPGYEAIWTEAATTGIWYFIYAYHDAVNNQIGISIDNGALVVTGVPEGQIVGGDSPFVVGARGTSLWFMDGRIDAVGFWKRTLTAGERTELWNNGNGLEYPF